MRDITAKGIVVAEDDADDRFMISRAFKEAGLDEPLEIVRDGVELMDYLRSTGEYEGRPEPWPKLILLDLNMPRLSGRDALVEIKKDPALRLIPIVILTTSSARTDVAESYAAGANAYLTKPTRFSDLSDLAKLLVDFWCGKMELADGNR